MKIHFAPPTKRASGTEHFGLLQSWFASFLREVIGVAILMPQPRRYSHRTAKPILVTHTVRVTKIGLAVPGLSRRWLCH